MSRPSWWHHVSSLCRSTRVSPLIIIFSLLLFLAIFQVDLSNLTRTPSLLLETSAPQNSNPVVNTILSTPRFDAAAAPVLDAFDPPPQPPRLSPPTSTTHTHTPFTDRNSAPAGLVVEGGGALPAPIYDCGTYSKRAVAARIYNAIVVRDELYALTARISALHEAVDTFFILEYGATARGHTPVAALRNAGGLDMLSDCTLQRCVSLRLPVVPRGVLPAQVKSKAMLPRGGTDQVLLWREFEDRNETDMAIKGEDHKPQTLEVWERQVAIDAVNQWLAAAPPPLDKQQPQQPIVILLSNALDIASPTAVNLLRFCEVSLPSVLPIAVEFMHSLNWVTRTTTTTTTTTTGSNEENGGIAVEGGGGAVAVAVAVEKAAVGSHSLSHPRLPGSARLSYFGGVEATAAALIRVGDTNLNEIASDFTHLAEAAKTGKSLGLDVGATSLIATSATNHEISIDARTWIVVLEAAVSRAAPPPPAYGKRMSPASWPQVNDSALVAAALAWPSCFTNGVACPTARFHLFCPNGGRFGNYRKSVWHGLAVARASGRVAVMPPSTDDWGSFTSVFALDFTSTLVVSRAAALTGLSNKGGEASVKAECLIMEHSKCDHFEVPEWLNTLSLPCGSIHSVVPPPVNFKWHPVWLDLVGLTVEETGGPPWGVHARELPVVIAGAATLSAQGNTYYANEWENESEFLSVRCGVDFSVPTLRRAFLWEQEGTLNGRPFAAVHVRREDFSSAFPSADTFMPIERLAAFVASKAVPANVTDVFVLANATPQERLELDKELLSRGLTPHTHPLSSFPDGLLIDSAIAGDAALFIGNVQSTFSHEVAFQFACQGRVAKVFWYRAKDATGLKQ